MDITMYHNLPKNITQHTKKSTVEDEDNDNIGIRPANSRIFCDQLA